MTKLWNDHSIFPMFWIEEFADLDAKSKKKLDDMFTNPLRAIHATQWILVRLYGQLCNQNYVNHIFLLRLKYDIN